MMKRYLFILLAFFTLSAKAQIQELAELTTAPGGQYGLVPDSLFRGGFRACVDTASRNNITLLRRKLGMWVLTRSNVMGSDTVHTVWELKTLSTANGNNWKKVNFSGASYTAGYGLSLTSNTFKIDTSSFFAVRGDNSTRSSLLTNEKVIPSGFSSMTKTNFITLYPSFSSASSDMINLVNIRHQNNTNNKGFMLVNQSGSDDLYYSTYYRNDITGFTPNILAKVFSDNNLAFGTGLTYSSGVLSATGGGTTTSPLTLGYGLTGASFNGSTAVTTRIDTSVIQWKRGVGNYLLADNGSLYYKPDQDLTTSADVTFNSVATSNIFATAVFSNSLKYQNSGFTSTLTTQALTANRNIKFQNKSYTVGDSAVVAGKQDALTLTTTGSGAATLVGATLNIPTPTSGNLTGDVTSVGLATTYNNVVPSTKGGAGAVSGLLKANGSGTVSAAVVGTDYEAAQTGTGYIKSAAGTKSYVTAIPNGDLANSAITVQGVSTSLGGTVNPINGTGFVKSVGATVSYDNSTYLTTSTAASTYVPYTGATTALDLGTRRFSTSGNTTLGNTYIHPGSGTSVLSSWRTFSDLDSAYIKRDTALSAMTIGNTVTRQGGPGGAIDFGVTNSTKYVTGSDANMPTGSSINLTVAKWIKRTNTATQTFIAYGGQATTAPGLSITYVTGTNLYTIYNGSANALNGSLLAGSISDGNWHYIAITIAGNSAKSYVDGNLINTQTLSAYNIQLNGVLSNGYNVLGTPYYPQGMEDQLAIWNTALPADSILANYNSGGGTPNLKMRSNIRRLFKYDDGSGSVALDSNPNGTQYPFTLVNSPAWVPSGSGKVPDATSNGPTEFIRFYDATLTSSTGIGGFGAISGQTRLSGLYISWQKGSVFNVTTGALNNVYINPLNTFEGKDANASAALEIESTTSGFLQPRMTTTQINAITSAAEGLSVWDLTLHANKYYNGSAWVKSAVNPMTTAGDIIIGGASGIETRLAAGTNGFLLGIVSGSPAYLSPGAATADVITTVTDADYTVTSTERFVKLPNITAIRTLTLPAAASYIGRKLTILNSNFTGTSYNWFTSPSLLSTGNLSLNSLKLGVTVAESDGTSWHVISEPSPQVYFGFASGNGSSTTISIAHGGLGISSSTHFTVRPMNTASAGISYTTIDATNVNIFYTTAPVSGTNNLSYDIQIKP